MTKKKIGAKEPTDANPVGRPPIYTKQIGNKICKQLTEGMSLNKICMQKNMPCKAIVHKWLNAPKTPELQEFLDNYMEARAIQAHGYVDEAIDIADETKNAMTSEEINSARLRLDTRKWVACKVLPKIYGDKIVNEHVGKDGADLIPMINVNIAKPNS